MCVFKGKKKEVQNIVSCHDHTHSHTHINTGKPFKTRVLLYWIFAIRDQDRDKKNSACGCQGTERERGKLEMAGKIRYMDTNTPRNGTDFIMLHREYWISTRNDWITVTNTK